jgi:hypothetical protein
LLQAYIDAHPTISGQATPLPQLIVASAKQRDEKYLNLTLRERVSLEQVGQRHLVRIPSGSTGWEIPQGTKLRVSFAIAHEEQLTSPAENLFATLRQHYQVVRAYD